MVRWYFAHMLVRKHGWCAALVLGASVTAVFAAEVRLVLNPYEGVDWEKVTQHKANLHTHTVSSGGKLFLHQVFAEYARRGYEILAITDHDLCTQWEKAGLDPVKEFGILPVMGQEYSQGQHVNGFFLNHETSMRDTAALAREITTRGGFAVINHPGRYWKPDVNGAVPPETRDEYVKLLDENPLILGIEVVNRNNRSPHDVALWDALLGAAMPARPVWGFANDDMHERKHIGQAWNIFLLETLDEVALRHAMLKGHFYFSARENGRGQEAAGDPPVIQSIVHDPAAQTITLSAAADGAVVGAKQCRWIAEGQTVCEGPVLAYSRVRGIGRYVRAEVKGKGGTTFSNPFGFRLAE